MNLVIDAPPKGSVHPPRTPPQIPLNAFNGLGSIDYLISSPVTPAARRPHIPFFPLDNEEESALSEMLKTSARHHRHESTMIARMHNIGNGPFILKRTIVIHWLIEVCASFHFEPPTLHLAVRHLDWFMSLRMLEQRNWQLCAITALFIAAKCEEAGGKVPIVDDLAHLCENVYPPASMLCMEVVMLSVLEWDLVAKTPVHFLMVFMAAVRRRFMNDGNLAIAAAHLNSSRPPGLDFSREGFLLDDDSDDESYTSAMHVCDCHGVCHCDDEDEDDDEALQCDEEMIFDNSSEQGHQGSGMDAMEEVLRVALCILELSLYDIINFPPNVIAAAALSIAVEVTDVEGVGQRDISTVTCVAEMETCRSVLVEHFNSAQTT